MRSNKQEVNALACLIHGGKRENPLVVYVGLNRCHGVGWGHRIAEVVDQVYAAPDGCSGRHELWAIHSRCIRLESTWGNYQRH